MSERAPLIFAHLADDFEPSASIRQMVRSPYGEGPHLRSHTGFLKMPRSAFFLLGYR